jgi:alkylation response protein AidB-like acyl-CoA dehydrogenase
VPIAITDEQRALQDSIRSWSAAAGTEDVRALETTAPSAREPWHDTRRWKELADLGVFGVAVSEEAGGGGGGLTDLAAALEQAAHALVPGPVLGTAVTAVLLDGTGSPALERVVSGRASVGVAADPGTLTAREENGRTLLHGEVPHVLAAAGSSHLLVPARVSDEWAWFLLDTAAPQLTERTSVDFSRPVASASLDGVEPAEQLPSSACELLVALAAAEASGIAGWCLRTAVEHAGAREQFGRVIGSFQAVKHLCAEMLCRVEQSSALAWNAARALDERSGEHPLAVAAAGAAVFEAAFENAKDCIQVLGGTGFTWEHDAHLYLRRATVLRQQFGDAGRWRGEVTELALSGARRSLEVGAGEIPADVERQRPAVRAEVERIAEHEPEQRRAHLAEAGYLAPEWPAPHGLGAEPPLQLLIDQELERAGVRRPALVVGAWAAPTVLAHGTGEQQRRFLRPTLRGDITWCQLFSEPGAGSDLASLSTRASREDSGWRLRGQKVWTSLAREADWAICLARTDPEAPRHRGITYFLVDMTTPGIEVRPLREITGDAVFNEVFLDGVFVPDECVVGQVDDGWKVARSTLATERVAISAGSALGDEVEELLERAARQPLTDEDRRRIGEVVARGLSVSVLGLRHTLRQIRGHPGAESSVEKLVGVQHRQDAAELRLDLFGPAGSVVDEDTSAAVHRFLNSRCLSIAGGTTQVLRTVVAERVLGLPREERR